MALQIRGSSQIKDASISLGKIEDLSAGKILGRAEGAADAAPAQLSGEDVRKIAELHSDDNVHFANIEADAIDAVSASLSGALSAASADLNDGQLDAGAANLASAAISGNVSAVNAAFSGTLSSGAATLASASIAGAAAAGSISSGSTLASAGKATLNSLEVSNDADLLGDAAISGDVSAANAAFSGTLSAGAATLASAAIQNAAVAGSMASNGTLSSAGKATLNSLEVSNDADILGAAAITGAVSAASADFGSGSLEAGAATLASAAISGDISADNASFSGDAAAVNAAFSGTLSAGASTLASAAIAGAVSAGSFASSAVNIDGGNIDGTAIGEDSRASGKFSVVDVTGSVTCNNLTVNGTLTTIDTTNLLVKDPMIQLGEGNSSDAIDLGFIGQYDSSKYAGLVRDADDSGVFKLFYTDEDLSSAQEVDFSSATKATLKADIKGDIEYAASKDWSISGDVAAEAVSYDGTGNVNLIAVIQPDSVEFSMLDCEIDEDDMASDSASHVPTQQSVKAYVDAQVASGGLSGLAAKDMQMVDSSGSFVAVHEAIQYASVDASVATANMVTLSDDYVAEFQDMLMVFLNGQKLRYTHDFTLANSDELHISGDIIEDGDVLEIRHFVKS